MMILPAAGGAYSQSVQQNRAFVRLAGSVLSPICALMISDVLTKKQTATFASVDLIDVQRSDWDRRLLGQHDAKDIAKGLARLGARRNARTHTASGG